MDGPPLGPSNQFGPLSLNYRQFPNRTLRSVRHRRDGLAVDKVGVIHRRVLVEVVVAAKKKVSNK